MGETTDQMGAHLAARDEKPLVVVLSEVTVEHLGGLAEAGWAGPIVIVGSVAEAREVIRDHAASSVPTPPPVQAPAPVSPSPQPAAADEISDGSAGTAPVLDLGRMRLDMDQRRVINAPLAESLTPLEFGVLEALLRRPGRVQRFAELTRSVWGVTYTGDCSQLHAVVRRLRGKLELVRAPVELCAVRGVGFRLAPQQERAQSRLGGVLASV